MSVIKVSEAKEQFEALVTRAEAGEIILIEKDGKAVARLMALEAEPATTQPKRKIDITALQEFTRSLPPATESAADLIRRMRDETY